MVGVDVQLHSFFTSSSHVPAALPPWKVTPLNCSLPIGSQVALRAGIDGGVNKKTYTPAEDQPRGLVVTASDY